MKVNALGKGEHGKAKTPLSQAPFAMTRLLINRNRQTRNQKIHCSLHQYLTNKIKG